MNILDLDIQLFAEGASASSGGEGGMSMGSMSSMDGSTTSYDDGQVATDNGASERSQAFNDIINGDYKAEAQQWLKDKLGKRMKGKDAKIQEYEDRLNQLNPALEKLAIKYGVTDPSDINSIMDAVDKDNSYFEEYALDHNVTTEQAKSLIEAERITRQNQQRLQEEENNREFDEWYRGKLEEAERLKGLYPAFDFDAESNDIETGERFRRLVQTDGVSLKDAFELVHKDDIMSGAMAYTMSQMAREQADNRTARQSRPSENGTSAQQPATISDDMSKLSTQEMKKIKDAVRSGNRVTKDNFRRFL